MNMVQKRDLIGKSEKLAIIIITLLEVTYLMVKFGVYEVKTIYTMIIIVFILTVFFVYLNVPPLLMSLLFFIRSKVILTNTTPTDTTHIETTTTDIPHIETIPMDIITETTHIETIPIETTPMYIMTEITPTDTTPLETIDNNINNTYIKVDSTNKDNFLGNKNKNKEKNKFDIAEKYIIEAFTGHCSEEGKKNICAVMKAYSNGETDFSNYSSISVKNLKVLDLYHFGWNIWNHFRVGEQDVIAKLLKIIFAEKFSRTSIKTIKSHLKDDEKKGRIIIKEDLSKLNE
jgi:putative mobilizable transposon, tnpC protein